METLMFVQNVFRVEFTWNTSLGISVNFINRPDWVGLCPKDFKQVCLTLGWSSVVFARPPLSSDIIIFTDRPELKAKGERIIFEDREVKKRKFSLRETALFNPDPILAKISRILTENWIIPVNWPFFHRFCAPMAYFRWILDDIDVSYPFATFYIQKNWFLGPKGQNLEIFKIFN